VLGVGLKKQVDETKPEKRRTPRRKDKREGRSFFKLSHDPAKVEAKGGRITMD
jgi:hypothetical protein